MELFIIFSEIFIIIFYYSILFNKGIKNICKYVVAGIIISFIFISIKTFNIILAKLINFIIQVFIISKIDKKEKLLTFIEVGISMVLVAVIEGITIICGYILNLNRGNNFILFCTIALLIVLILIIKFKNKINLENLLVRHKLLWGLGLNLIIFVLFIIISLEVDLSSKYMNLIDIILLILLLSINYFYYKSLFFQLEEKRNLELNSQYKLVIDELIDKFKINEHEYKNHLNTIRAMISIDNNKENIENYILGITKLNIYSKIDYIDNPIIKAILYNKIKECEEKKIDFRFRVMSDLKLIKVDDIELSIILNNLLNNAIEAVEFLEERKISLKILENENYEIIIKNSIKEDKQIDFIKLFKKGYSTKGKNRGVGLYNIKDIVNRYNGQLNLINKNKYLIISIIFKK